MDGLDSIGNISTISSIPSSSMINNSNDDSVKEGKSNFIKINKNNENGSAMGGDHISTFVSGKNVNESTGKDGQSNIVNFENGHGNIVNIADGGNVNSYGTSPPKFGIMDRVVLTTYPTQVGIEPIPLIWGANDSQTRGPVLVSRLNLKRRNAIGAHSGSYCIYHALAVAAGELAIDHRPDYTNTEPPIKIGPHAAWFDIDKIVSLDPWGHLAQTEFSNLIRMENLDIHPTIAITKAHMKIPELNKGSFSVDGKIVLNDDGELSVTKVAIEPVWYLPGIAKRFGIDETRLRRILFEDAGGMYPELITRPDLKLFLPPIAGLSAIIFGPVEKLSDGSGPVAVRVHDECNGSDVFGSDICTCRPYLIHGIKRCVETAQMGGAGLIVYFRKEGRALGEVTKYLVYNARKRQEGGDRASTYFQRTEAVAGVKDMRFHALMPDVLHWFGIKKIDEMLSMSNMKYDAIIKSGIEIVKRVEIPEELLPQDSRVEIEAKIASGYFSEKKHHEPTFDLNKIKGRNWEDLNH